MSLILEALRKSEAQRRLGQAPDLLSPGTPVKSRGRLPRWLLPALALMLVGAVAWWLGRMAVPDPSNGTATEVVLAPVPLDPAPASDADTAPAAPASDPSPPRAGAGLESPAATPATSPRPRPPAPSTAATATTTAAPAPTAAPPVPVPVPVTPAETTPAPAVTGSRPLPVTAFPTPPPQPPPVTSGESDAGLLRLADLPATTRAGLPELRISMHVFSEEPSRRFAIIDGRRVGEGGLLEGQGVVEAIRRDGIVVDFDGQRVLLPRP